MAQAGVRKGVGSFFTVAILLYGLVWAGQALAGEQKGDVVFATYYPNFYQVGGDPATHSSGFPVVGQTIFDSLIYADKEQNQVPSLAESWKVSDGWRTMDFILEPGVKFHNGATVTAEDVKYSLETYLREELKFLFYPLWKRNIKSIEIVGPRHIRITLNKPDPGFLGRLWWSAGIFPKAYREKVGDQGFADKPVGTGPFKWAGYKQDVYWKGEAVKSHFRHTPEIKTFTMRYVPEHSTRLAMLKAGEADIIFAIGPHIPELKADPNLKVIWGLYPVLQAIIFADQVAPDEDSPFHDIRVRKAASLAIDRQAICDKILFGASEPYGEALAPITWGYDPTIKPDPYDPETARALLKEAGYPNGFKTTIHTTRTNRYWFEAVAANLADVGIQTDLKVYEGGAYQVLQRARKLRGLIASSLWYHSEKHASADASDFFLSYMRPAYTTTPEIHQAVLDGMTAQTEEEMTAVGKKISKLIRESRVRILLWANHTPYGAGMRIKFWEPQLGALPGTAYEYITLQD